MKRQAGAHESDWSEELEEAGDPNELTTEDKIAMADLARRGVVMLPEAVRLKRLDDSKRRFREFLETLENWRSD